MPVDRSKPLQGAARFSRSALLSAWVLLAIVTCAVDYYAGSFLHFPILAVIPVLLAAWHNGLLAGLVLAILLPLVRLYFAMVLWPTQVEAGEALGNAAVRIPIMVLLAVLADGSARKTRVLMQRVSEIEGLLPICGFCKNIRDANDEWQPLETFLTKRTDAVFSHGLCPTCAKLQYGDLGSGLEHDDEPGSVAAVHTGSGTDARRSDASR